MFYNCCVLRVFGSQFHPSNNVTKSRSIMLTSKRTTSECDARYRPSISQFESRKERRLSKFMLFRNGDQQNTENCGVCWSGTTAITRRWSTSKTNTSCKTTFGLTINVQSHFFRPLYSSSCSVLNKMSEPRKCKTCLLQCGQEDGIHKNDQHSMDNIAHLSVIKIAADQNLSFRWIGVYTHWLHVYGGWYKLGILST